MNEITIHGNVTADLTLSFGRNGAGVAFTSFTVAVNRSYFDRTRNARVDMPTVFQRVVAFGKLARTPPLVVDGALARDLERHGVHVHARPRPPAARGVASPAGGPDVRWDRVESWRKLADRKRGPFRRAAGTLAHLGPGPDLEDYEAASRLAADEAGAEPRLPE